MSSRICTWALLDILELPLGAIILQQLGCPGACEALPGVSCGAKRLRLRMVCHSDLMCPLGLGGGSTHLCCLVSGCGFRVPRGVRAHVQLQKHMQSCPNWMVRDHGRFWCHSSDDGDIMFTRPQLRLLHTCMAADDDALASRWSNQSEGAALLAGAVKCPAFQCDHSGSLSSILEHVATCSLAQRHYRTIDLFEGAFHSEWSRARHFLDDTGRLRHENNGPWRSYYLCKFCKCRVSDRSHHRLWCNRAKNQRTYASIVAERNQDCSRNYQRCPTCALWVNMHDVELNQAEATASTEVQEPSRSISQFGGRVGATIGAVPGAAPCMLIGGMVGATIGAMQGTFVGDSYWNTFVDSTKNGARLGGFAGIVITSPLMVAGCAVGGVIGAVGDVTFSATSSR